MPLQFRNVDASPADEVATWPYEALVTAIDRGLVPDWQPIFTEIRRSPWGRVARRVQHHLVHREPDGVSVLFAQAIERARRQAEERDRGEVAARVRAAVQGSGLTAAAFAELVGTSPSRLSTYSTGKVKPSAAMLVRIERAGTQAGSSRLAGAVRRR